MHKLLKSGRSGEQYPFLLLLLMNDQLDDHVVIRHSFQKPTRCMDRRLTATWLAHSQLDWTEKIIIIIIIIINTFEAHSRLPGDC